LSWVKCKIKVKKEIDQILREGAVTMFLKEDVLDKEIESFANSSIEEILKSRTDTISRDDKDKPDMFSQAVFVADEKGANVDINSKDFWERIGVRKIHDQHQAFRDAQRGRRRRQVNYKEDDYFNPAKGDDSDYDDSGMEEVEDGPGILRGLESFRWGQWDKFHPLLSASERKRIDNDLKKVKIAALQTLAYILTAGRNKASHRHWMNNPAAIQLVRDETLKEDVLAELVRTNMPDPESFKPKKKPTNSTHESDEKENKLEMKKVTPGESLFDRMRLIGKDLVDHKALNILFHSKLDDKARSELKINIARMFTFKTICEVVKVDLSKVNWDTIKITKRMPEWWNGKLDEFLAKGSLIHGWGVYNAELAKGFKDLIDRKKLETIRIKKRGKRRKKKQKQAEEDTQTVEEKLKEIHWLHGGMQMDRLKTLCSGWKKQIKDFKNKKKREASQKKRDEEKKETVGKTESGNGEKGKRERRIQAEEARRKIKEKRTKTKTERFSKRSNIEKTKL